MSDALGFLPDTKPYVTEPWRTVLLDAADYIEAHGWCQGHMGEPGGQRCVLGAVMSSSKERTTKAGAAAWGKFRDWLGGAIPADWNDTPGRTAAEVTAALRACARQ